MKAFIFAAGLGTRLRPYTQTVPKPLLELYTKPIIEYIFMYLQKLHVRDITINTYYLKKAFINVPILARKYNINAQVSEQTELYEQAGDLAFAKKFLEDLQQNESFVLINADTLIYIEPSIINEYAKLINEKNPLLLLGFYSQSNKLIIQNDQLVAHSTTKYKEPSDSQPLQYGDYAGIMLGHGTLIKYLVKPGKQQSIFGAKGLVDSIIKSGNNVLYQIPKTLYRVEIGTVSDYEQYTYKKELWDILQTLSH